MQINWFTVIAQIVNFLILVWLLKKFLYKPVLNAIDEREKKIASQLNDAAAKTAEAKKESDDFRQKNEAFDAEKKEQMNKVVAEIEEKRKVLLEDARKEAEAFRLQQEKTSKDVQDNLNGEIEQKVQKEVFAITRKTLTDLASVSLEEQSVNVFVKRLNDLKDEEKKQFMEACKPGTTPVLVRSNYKLPAKQQAEIKKSFDQLFGTDTQFEFKVTPELISGIELTSNGYKLAWSVSEYLNSLEKSIVEMIKEKQNAGTEKSLACPQLN